MIHPATATATVTVRQTPLLTPLHQTSPPPSHYPPNPLPFPSLHQTPTPTHPHITHNSQPPLMHRTTPRPLRLPPRPNAFSMKFTQTLQPTHLVADRKLLEADDAFLALGAVVSDAVFFAGVVDDHAGGAAGTVLRCETGRWKRRRLRRRDGRCRRQGGSGGGGKNVRGGAVEDGPRVGSRRGGGRGGDGGGRGGRGWWVRGARGGGGEVRFDAGGDVLFAGGFTAVGTFGWEGGVADGAFVFFAENGD